MDPFVHGSWMLICSF